VKLISEWGNWFLDFQLWQTALHALFTAKRVLAKPAPRCYGVQPTTRDQHSLPVSLFGLGLPHLTPTQSHVKRTFAGYLIRISIERTIQSELVFILPYLKMEKKSALPVLNLAWFGTWLVHRARVFR
jgi:hypothetical protein